MRQKEISRRSFIKGSLAAGAFTALGTVGMAGESLAQEETSKTTILLQEEKAKYAPSEDDTTYGLWVNPQSEDAYKKTEFKHLFSPLKIGGVTLKNRIVKSAAGSEMQDNSEWPSDAALAYYGQFCKGGVGMVCYESSTIIPMGAMPGAMPGAEAGVVPGAMPEGDPGAMPVPGADAGTMPEAMSEAEVVPGAEPAGPEGMPAEGAAVPGMPEGMDAPSGMNALDMTTDKGIRRCENPLPP